MINFRKTLSRKFEEKKQEIMKKIEDKKIGRASCRERV